MIYIDNRGALTLTKKKLLITLGVVLGVALIAWGVLMVAVFRKGKDRTKYKDVYLLAELRQEVIIDDSFDPHMVTKLKREYDKDGRLTRQETFDDHGHLFETETYEYDGKGNLTSYIKEFSSADFPQAGRVTHVYDVSKNESRITHYDSKNEAVSEKIYSGKGEMIIDCDEESVFLEYNNDRGDLLFNMGIYEDGTDALQDECVYSEEGVLLQKFFLSEYVRDYYYDESGKLTRTTYSRIGSDYDMDETIFYENGSYKSYYLNNIDHMMHLREEANIDEHGNCVFYRMYNVDDSIAVEITNEYKYNKDGKCIYKLEQGDTFKPDIDEFYYEYNERDLIKKETRYTNEEFSYTYEYEYDENQNIIKRSDMSEDGTVNSITEYKYYEESDGKVMVVSEITNFSNGGSVGFYYETDSNGYPIRKTMLNSNGTERVTEERKYKHISIPVLD